MPRIHVVAGIIYNPSGDKILIAKRPEHLHQGGLWEFPGGKIEAEESPQQALQRELKEELSIDVLRCQPYLTIHHDYADKQVLLDVWQVTEFSGVAEGSEGQDIAWVAKENLVQYPFPKANAEIVARLTAS